MNKFGAVLGVSAAMLLGACETMSPSSNTMADAPQPESGNRIYAGRGVVKDIDRVSQDSPDNSMGLGTVAGALVGGIVGNQIGSGSGKTIATVAGVAGGAYAGHQLEKGNRRQEPDLYRFSVRMDNGSYQTLLLNSNPDLRVGDRVQIDNGVMRRY